MDSVEGNDVQMSGLEAVKLERDNAQSARDRAVARVTAASETEAVAKAAFETATEAAKTAEGDAKAEADASVKTAKEAVAAASKELKEAKAEQAKADKLVKAVEKRFEAERVKDEKRQKAAEAKQAKQLAAEQSKSEREENRMPEQNGIRRPKPDSLCGRAWGVFDDVSRGRGSPASISETLPVARGMGINEATVRTQYARWRKFYGVSGRVEPVKPSDEAQLTA